MRLALVLACLATPALAVTPVRVWTSSDGVVFTQWPSTEGALLRSASPVTYHVGAAGLPVTGIETVLLRPDCTAKSALGGEGFWMRQGEGFYAGFVEGAGLWFEQAPPEGAGEGCGP